jgi:hypothetical protein
MIRRLFFVLAVTVIFSCTSGESQITKSAQKEPAAMQFFQRPKGKTFNVDRVEWADSLLRVDTTQRVFEGKLGRKILFYPKEHSNFRVVSCYNNAFIETIQECYAHHRPLVLSPDAIWLTICQGMSIHINEKFDSLEKIIFVKDKPDKIVVRNDSLGEGEKHWNDLIASFSDETKKYTKSDFYSLFVGDYSTTTTIEQTAYRVTLLESYKKAFEYVGESGCGIPAITLTGKKEDWQTVLRKLDQLEKIGMSEWAINLRPVIQEFVNVFDNKYNTPFWSDIFKDASEYGAYYISGWVLKFFPYIKIIEEQGEFDLEKSTYKSAEKYITNPFFNGEDYLLSTLSTDNIPSGLAKIDVIWNNYLNGETREMEVYAGFFAMKQYDDKSLEPMISWAICDKGAKEVEYEAVEQDSKEIMHKEKYWSPNFPTVLTDSATYDIKTHKNSKTSFDFVRDYLENSIASEQEFSEVELTGDTLEWVVLSNGKLTQINYLGKNESAALENYCRKQLTALPKEWFPALAHPRNILDSEFSAEENMWKIKVNSKVRIVF